MNGTVMLDETVSIESLLLGPLELRAGTLIDFVAGLPGFPLMRRFALVETQREDLVWLQSVDDATLTFLLADPFSLVEGFAVELPAADLAALDATMDTADALLVLAVAQVDGGQPIAANLQSPIVINRDRRIGRQVVLPDSRYGMQHPIQVD
jgi:flagellar assembly factor FliW